MPHTPSSPDGPHDAEKPRTSADEAKTDAAVQAFKARGQWPLAAEAAKTPTASQTRNATDRSPQLSQKPRNRWRTVGIGALGLLGGLLLGVVFQDILATIVTDTELTDVSFVFAPVLPLFAALGIVATIFFDKWFARRRRPKEHT
ncbi:MAG TPA: hypothetical protein VIG82_06030 [Enteractinococcus sp.]